MEGFRTSYGIFNTENAENIKKQNLNYMRKLKKVSGEFTSRIYA